jgi:cytochrome c oxidase subunit II
VRRGSLVQLVLIGLVAGGIATAVAVAVPWLPDWAGEEADRIGFTFWFTTIISLGIFTVVAAVTIFAVWRFRAAPGDESDGPPIHGHTCLEIAWTIVPVLLVVSIAVVSAVVLAKNSKAGSDPLVVKVVGQQFAWQFTYPNGKTYGQLRLPVDRHTRLEVTAKDVIHSFWVPELAQKQDAVPDEVNPIVVTPDRTGTFPVICTELCGIGHAIMRTSAIVMPESEFEAWLKSGGSENAAGGSGAGNGAATFKSAGCGACHTFAAAGSAGKVGPDLDSLASTAQKAGKSVEDYVHESIVDPNAYVVEGYQPNVMPSFEGSLSAEQIDALVQFLVKEQKPS